MPFFSILIPTYNSSADLQNAINSIRSQTFTDYEVVFVDGESKDNTIALIDLFKTTNNVKYISEPDKGIYDAMNKGIRLVTGKWICFLGSDDRFYSNNVLENIHREIQKEPVDLIYGNVMGETSKKHYVYDTINMVLSQGIHHQSIFYKKSVFDTVGQYDTFFKVASDYHLTLKAFCTPKLKTRYIDLDIVNYGENGLSSITFDYTFFSYHYRLLAQRKALLKVDEPEKCLDKSIYCCFQLAQRKTNVLFAWENLLYYVIVNSRLSLGYRIKTLLRMLYWTIKPANSLPTT